MPEIWKIHPQWMPMWEVVWKGDERTFLFAGFLGRSAAVFWMEKFMEASRNPNLNPDYEGLPDCLTASAGIAIVHQRFPFSRAFALAEELTRAAKNARKKAKDPGCWLDFEIVRDGTSGRLAEMRSGRKSSEQTAQSDEAAV